MTKTLGLSCSIITYGVIIKALLRSHNPSLEAKAFEILSNIPALGYQLNAEIFNQVRNTDSGQYLGERTMGISFTRFPSLLLLSHL